MHVRYIFMSVHNDLVNESYSIIGIDSKQIEPIILYFHGYLYNAMQCNGMECIYIHTRTRTRTYRL